MKRLFSTLTLAALAMLPSAASAADFNYISGHVKTVEGSNMPNGLLFEIDSSASSACPVGTTLHWIPSGSDADTQQKSNQAVYALLLTAKATGQPVQIFGNNSGCTVQLIYWGEQ